MGVVWPVEIGEGEVWFADSFIEAASNLRNAS